MPWQPPEHPAPWPTPPPFCPHPAVQALIQTALEEDLGRGPQAGDHTTQATIPADAWGQAVCKLKAAGVLAGVQFAEQVYATVDNRVRFTPHLADGNPVQPGDLAFTVEGPIRALLIAERLVLNVLQRMSGIATVTRQVADALAHTQCRVLDTRKTTPGFRHFEKWAVMLGGGVNHRVGLFDQILVKDNHVDAAGGITAALDAVATYQAQRGTQLPVVLEVRTLDELDQALAHGGLDRVLLDNMPPPILRQAVDRIAGRLTTEASGGITPQNVRAVAEAGVDFVSMGALTHSAPVLDANLKLTATQPPA